jgi:hypothetical protein
VFFAVSRLDISGAVVLAVFLAVFLAVVLAGFNVSPCPGPLMLLLSMDELAQLVSYQRSLITWVR